MKRVIGDGLWLSHAIAIFHKELLCLRKRTHDEFDPRVGESEILGQKRLEVIMPIGSITGFDSEQKLS